VLKKGITGKKELNSRSIEKSEETKVVKKSPKKISPKKISPKKISPRITSISPVRPIIKVGDINGLLEEYRQPSTIVDKIQMFLKSN
jgi:hypothetical protein